MKTGVMYEQYEVNYFKQILIFLVIGDASSITTITTNPPSTTCLTAGLTNLLVEGKFEKQTTSQCAWRYGGPLDNMTFYISGLGGGCQADFTRSNDKVTCDEETINGSFHITTNLTIGGPLTEGILNLAFACISSTRTAIKTPSTFRRIESCSVDATTYPGVTASCDPLCNYLANATLSCVTGGDIATTCGADCTFASKATCAIKSSTCLFAGDVKMTVILSFLNGLLGEW
ncbi:uncharacterized protein LOC143446307 isoform X1 [Clavelina lepadiformis]|uniref:uncharacterized protein LOC143446307 isoform X1 n=1 Tax=Clavelina lepadiformis TaxID=159417 RepID=UPI0040414679